MKFFITIIFHLLSTLWLFSQNNPGELSLKLTAGCKTDKEKVTSIFRWITDNISYKLTPRFRNAILGKASFRFSRYEGGIDEDTGVLKPLNERVAIEVLKRREAVCDGYARLFSTLCDYAGIKSEVIVGYARNNENRPSTKFGVNHYWNAVYFDESWHLLDATWASGYIKRDGGAFIKEYTDKYFLTNPYIFINDHYPDDMRWTLLPDTEIPEEFRHSPFKQKSFVKYKISSFSPHKGIIEASMGDTIKLELVITDTETDHRISPSMLIDSTIFSHSASWVFLKPTVLADLGIKKKYSYNYTISSGNVEWLYLLYNDDLILRYKVNMTKKKM